MKVSTMNFTTNIITLHYCIMQYLDHAVLDLNAKEAIELSTDVRMREERIKPKTRLVEDVAKI